MSQTANIMKGDVSIRDRSRSYTRSCESCHQTFQTRVFAPIHAADTSHISNHFCESCQKLYRSSQLLEDYQLVLPDCVNLSLPTHAQVTPSQQQKGKTESLGQARQHHQHQARRRMRRDRSPHAWTAESSNQNQNRTNAQVASERLVHFPTETQKQEPSATVARG